MSFCQNISHHHQSILDKDISWDRKKSSFIPTGSKSTFNFLETFSSTDTLLKELISLLEGVYWHKRGKRTLNFKEHGRLWFCVQPWMSAVFYKPKQYGCMPLQSFHAERVQLTDNNGISAADIDFLSRLYLMTFKGQYHYINGRAQTSVIGQHNGTSLEQFPHCLEPGASPWDRLAALKDGRPVDLTVIEKGLKLHKVEHLCLGSKGTQQNSMDCVKNTPSSTFSWCYFKASGLQGFCCVGCVAGCRLQNHMLKIKQPTSK